LITNTGYETVSQLTLGGLRMNAEIIGVGTELLLGQIANTDAQYLSQKLSQLGINLFYHTVVGDNMIRVKQALAIAIERVDLIITTGGLGPTMDDLTKEAIAEFLGLRLIAHQPSIDALEAFFVKRGRTISKNNYKQAYFPEGSIVLPNSVGTAPGAGCNSYLVMAGPLLTWSTLADIPKLIKVSSNSLALFLTLAPLNLDSFAASGSSNKVIGGKE
jgi:molybdenum cofactor synthesis domain-containing protein